MANYSIKTDLLKLQGAFVSDIQGKTATKRCICIPLDGSGLYVGQKGIYLNLTAVELKEPKYEDTHLVKVNVPTETYKALTEEQRKAIPILGGLHAMQQQTAVASQTTTQGAAFPQPQHVQQAQNTAAATGDDLPF